MPGDRRAPNAPVNRAPLGNDPRHGPLPPLLLVLTVVSGLVDAVSVLRLGRVFVANMTGNVVFTGFALVGAPGFSLSTSLSALVGFLVSATLFAVATRRIEGDRALVLLAATGSEVVLVGAAMGLSAAGRLHGLQSTMVAALLAVAMGFQNAATRLIAVPDLNTTVLTTTLTHLAIDLPRGGRGPALTRRLLAVATMLAGGAAGAWLVLHVSATATLALAAALLALVTLGAAAAARTPGPWRDLHSR